MIQSARRLHELQHRASHIAEPPSNHAGVAGLSIQNASAGLQLYGCVAIYTTGCCGMTTRVVRSKKKEKQEKEDNREQERDARRSLAHIPMCGAQSSTDVEEL